MRKNSKDSIASNKTPLIRLEAIALRLEAKKLLGSKKLQLVATPSQQGLGQIEDRYDYVCPPEIRISVHLEFR